MSVQEPITDGLDSPMLSNAREYLSNRLIPDEVIIKSDRGMTKNQMSAHASRAGGVMVGSIGRAGLFLVKLAKGVSQSAAIASLKESPGVSGAFPNILFAIPEKYQIQRPQKQDAAIPHKRPPVTRPVGADLSRNLTNDPLLGYEWHLPAVRESLSSAGLGSGAPVIAVIDTGVDYTHPDLSGKVLSGFNFVNNTDSPYDDNGHGTHVAGIAAAVNNNAIGVHGMCPDCMVLPVKVLDDTGSGTWFEVMAGIDYADQRIDQLGGAPGTKGILSMSLGGMADPSEPAYVEMAALINSVAANNKLIAVAAGNDNDLTYTYCHVPGNAPLCGGYLTYIPAAMVKVQTSGLSVAASNPSDYRAYFSNSNPAFTNIVAPGRFIWSTIPWGYDAWEGTSMATPIVSGSAGRVWVKYPTYTAAQVTSKLLAAPPANQLGTSRGFASTLPRLDVAYATASQACNIAGYVVNPEAGEWGVNGGLSQPINRVSVAVTDGNTTPPTLVGTVRTNATGFFTAIGLSCSKAYSLTYSKPGYVSISQNVTTGASLTVNAPPVFMPIARTVVAPFDEILVTLEWSSVEPFTPACAAGTGSCTDTTNRGSELDLYLGRPDGTTVYYGNTGDINGALTRDSWDDSMPGEALYIKDLMTGGSNTYTIAVNRLMGGPMTVVGARVKVYKGSVLFANYYVPAACGTASTADWWTVATINATTKAITPGAGCSGIAPF